MDIGFFDGTVWSAISELAQIQLENHPNLPQEICGKCFGQLGAAIQFRNRIKTSNLKLQTLQPECFLQLPSFDQDEETEETIFPDDDNCPSYDLIDEKPEGGDLPLVADTSSLRYRDEDESENQDTAAESSPAISQENVLKSCEEKDHTEPTEAALLIDTKKPVSVILKKQSAREKLKQSEALTRTQIEAFCRDAPNESYLMAKVALIFGVFGGLSRRELFSVKIEDISEVKNVLVVSLPRRKSKRKPRTFKIKGAQYISYYKMFLALRPTNTPHNKLFIHFNKGECKARPMGFYKFQSLPREIANFLNLPNPEKYSGNCFKNSSEIF